MAAYGDIGPGYIGTAASYSYGARDTVWDRMYTDVCGCLSLCASQDKGAYHDSTEAPLPVGYRPCTDGRFSL